MRLIHEELEEQFIVGTPEYDFVCGIFLRNYERTPTDEVDGDDLWALFEEESPTEEETITSLHDDELDMYLMFNNNDGTGWHMYDENSVVSAEARWTKVERGRGGAVTKDHVEAYVGQQVTVSFTGEKPDITGKLLKVSSKTLSLELDDGTVGNPKLQKIAEVHPVDDDDNVDGEAAVTAAVEDVGDNVDDADDADDAAGTGLVAEAADDTVADDKDAQIAELKAENTELKDEIAELKDEIAELKAAQPDLFASQTSAERKKYVKDRGWYINQNTVTEDDVRAYQVRADHFAALTEEEIEAKKAELTTNLPTNMALMGALSPYKVPNIGRMKKQKLLDALAFFLLTNQ